MSGYAAVLCSLHDISILRCNCAYATIRLDRADDTESKLNAVTFVPWLHGGKLWR